MMWRKLAFAALIAAAVAGSAQAEVNKVRMSKQFGLPYLPMIVIETQQLIEKHAKAAGLDVETAWNQTAGPAADLRKSFQNPPDDARIMMRWWWFGPGVAKPELEKEMRMMKAGGIGGFEVQPVYPLALDDPTPPGICPKSVSL